MTSANGQTLQSSRIRTKTVGPVSQHFQLFLLVGTSLFEESRGCIPRWCGQPLRVVRLGRDGMHLACDLSPVRSHSLWASLCPEKLVNRRMDDHYPRSQSLGHGQCRSPTLTRKRIEALGRRMMDDPIPTYCINCCNTSIHLVYKKS